MTHSSLAQGARLPLVAAQLASCPQHTASLESLPPCAPPPCLQLSLNRLTVCGDGGVEVEAVGSPDRRGVAFGASYPPSPTRQTGLAARNAPGAAGAAAADPARQSSTLLAAALRLQGIGGRSVGLQKSR